MSESREESSQTGIEILAELVHPQEPVPLWRREELGAILRHQLAAPLEFNFAENGTATLIAPPTEPPIRSFGELLAHQSPPLVLLEMTKDFAKCYMNEPAGDLPREVGAVLYYASILAARLRHRVRITALDDSGIRTGTRWALQQEWVGEVLGALFQAGIELLES